MGRSGRPVVGFVLGGIGGVLWGWFGSGGYEAGDSMLGTGLLCALAGLLIGSVAYTVAGRRDRRRR
ncbi:hypothetical protein [Actinoplanes sp. NPDC049118]|uniref:hypothetical protein n=1 Tax=Actinoplanes sp. NPDC049118 TaxID=3155769 RepID=UPI0033CA3DB3